MGFRGPAARTEAERFRSKIAPRANGCVEWTAGTNQVGYGVFHLSPAQGSRKVYAHRWAYEQARGAIPDGMHLDHLCRNTLCVNPDHLQAVTARENLRRGVGFAGTNARKTHCPAGHPYSGDNVYIRPASGSRVCATCRRQRDSARTPRGRSKKRSN